MMGTMSAPLVGCCAAGLHHLGQAVAVVFVQLIDALVHAGEGFAVRGQRQRVGGQRQEFVDGALKTA